MQPVKLVAGNKCDLKDCRVVSSRQGLEYARSRGCGFMETSAREMVNIEETFSCRFPFPFSSSFSFLFRIPDEERIGRFHCVLILDGSLIAYAQPCA